MIRNNAAGEHTISSRMRSALLAVGFLGSVAVLGCTQNAGDTIGEPPPWACDGIVLDGQRMTPLDSVSVWVSGLAQCETDTSGTYHVVLGFQADAIDTLRFTREGYGQVVGLLDTARVVGNHRYEMNITMMPGN